MPLKSEHLELQILLFKYLLTLMTLEYKKCSFIVITGALYRLFWEQKIIIQLGECAAADRLRLIYFISACNIRCLKEPRWYL